ncbi:helix-turn-helix domain-containing protein [Acinetobacter sp. YH12070]|uniref:helix-turn-helix domain-containing protein n=1 Tax=Acinetobacter sp. YH12070 TaxID=2601066 RepID=UPI0015D41F47|nr:helix-turn-helix transcriptional regulator [Acinetobacter sp. YH12070]
MSINEKFLERGARLKAERNRLKLTQPEMAEIIGKAVGSIVRYEKHGDALNQDQLIALSNAGFDVFYITFGLRADTLSEPEHEIVTAYRSLGDDAKVAFVKMVKAYVAQ